MSIKNLTVGVQKFLHNLKFTSPYVHQRFITDISHPKPSNSNEVTLPEPLSQRKLGQANFVKNFRCTVNNPKEHSLNDIGKFYTIPEELLTRIMSDSWDTFMVSKQFGKHVKAFNEHCHMVRKPGLELVHYLKNASYDLPVNRYLLYGPAGSGKSMTLNYAMQYAMSQKWLVVPCLHTWDWTHFHYTSKEDQRSEVIKSQFEENRYDQPEKAGDWLKTFHLVNHQLLSTLHTTKDYVWSRRDETPAGSTFLQLVEQGLARVRYAPDVIGALAWEILHQDSTKFPKTLVAVDCVNVFFNRPMLLKMMYGVIPEAHELSYFHHMRKLMSNNWKNGAVVAAISTFGGGLPVDIEEHPYDSLTNEGFDCLDPHVPIEVPKYTEKEVLSQLAYYIDRKWLTGKSLVEASEAEIIQLSDHNPRDLSKLCAHLP